MKLVITYTEGDGCSYSCDVTECVEYESAEAFICDLGEWVTENIHESFLEYGSGFLGTNISPNVFLERHENGFYVRQLEHWFNDTVEKRLQWHSLANMQNIE